MSGLDFLPSDQRRLFIGGQWSDAEGGGTFDVLDPADGSVLTQVADGRSPTGSGRSTPRWPRRPTGRARRPRDRGEILRRGVRAGRRAQRRLRRADEPRDGQDRSRRPPAR